MDGADVLLREQALKKEASRVAIIPDYRNVPGSFQFFKVNGRPGMAYLATFTTGGQVMTEHFVRVLGPAGYVMIFTQGRIEEVKAILPELMAAVSTLKCP